MPELCTGDRTVILEQAEATIRYRGARHEAWAADDTGGHWWRYQGGIEGILGEYRPDFRHVGLLQLDSLGGIDLDEAGHARDALQGAGQVLDLRQGGLREHQAGGDEEDDSKHRDLDQRDDGGQILWKEVIHAPVQHPGDNQAYETGTRSPQHGLRDGFAAEAAELALEQEATDDRTGDEAKAIGRTEQNHHAVRVGRHQRGQKRKDDLGQRDAGDDEGRRPGFLAGIEHAQVQQH